MITLVMIAVVFALVGSALLIHAMLIVRRSPVTSAYAVDRAAPWRRAGAACVVVALIIIVALIASAAFTAR